MESVQRPDAPNRFLAALLAVWFGSAAAGLWVLAAYDNTPGQAAASIRRWPADSRLRHDPARATLVMLAHPHCTCTRASLAELTEILARATNRPKTYVLFLRPRGFAEGWEQTDLWQAAQRLPDTTAVLDDTGAYAEQFGAATSGQTFLYDANGVLLFSGGITGARAHAGENAGRTEVLALLARATRDDVSETRVFGCSLFAPSLAGPKPAPSVLQSQVIP